MSEILWQPGEAQIQQANITRFMKKHKIVSYEALIKKSTQEPLWFWQACLEDLNLRWQKPYQQLLDDTAGFAWSKWFVGGQLNIVDHCLDYQVEQGRGEKTAFIWEGDCGAVVSMTYGELQDKVGRLAKGLQALGVEKGDRVGLYLPMVPEMVVSFFACLKIGAVVIPVFSGFGPSPLSVRLNHAEAKLLITADGSFRRGKKIAIKEQADQAAAKVPSLKHLLVVKRSHEEIPWQEGRDLWWDEVLAAQSEPAETVITEAEDPSMILYTSGTTGLPKGTVHTHAGALAQVTKEIAYNFDTKPEDVFFWVTDIGWMMGPWEMMGTLALGSTFVIFEGAPDYPQPDRLWEMIEKHRVSIFGISPTAIRLLMKSPSSWVTNRDLSSLRILGSTGEAWDPASYDWFFKQVGGERCPIINISGGTEIIGCLLAPLPIHPLKACSLQGPGLGMNVDVFNEEGKSVRGEVGYLVCKNPAPSMTKGFYKDKERYLETYFSKFKDTWFHGDWAKVDEDGYWFIQGRADDTIKVSGRRTGPAEIEAALIKHEAVAEAAAIGVPHEIKGETVVAFVVLKEAFSDTVELLTALKKQVGDLLGKTLAPEKIHVVQALPKTRSAKIVRRAIKAKYLGKALGDLSSVENPEALEGVPVT